MDGLAQAKQQFDMALAQGRTAAARDWAARIAEFESGHPAGETREATITDLEVRPHAEDPEKLLERIAALKAGTTIKWYEVDTGRISERLGAWPGSQCRSRAQSTATHH